MGNDLGAVFLSQQTAKRMIDDVLYGKPEPRRKSRFKMMLRKILK